MTEIPALKLICRNDLLALKFELSNPLALESENDQIIYSENNRIVETEG